MPAALGKKWRGAMQSNPHGRWWSYRLIDGRKCWYEGKPGFSKSLLEWPAQAKAPAQSGSKGEFASALTKKPTNPLDSQAGATTHSDTLPPHPPPPREHHFTSTSPPPIPHP